MNDPALNQLVGLFAGLFIGGLIILVFQEIARHVIKAFRDAPLEDVQPFHELFTREDLEAVVNARQQKAWEKWHRGETITDDEAKLIGMFPNWREHYQQMKDHQADE